eukprot:2066304-Amphidinium_carterae.1
MKTPLYLCSMHWQPELSAEHMKVGTKNCTTATVPKLQNDTNKNEIQRVFCTAASSLMHNAWAVEDSQ